MNSLPDEVVARIVLVYNRDIAGNVEELRNVFRLRMCSTQFCRVILQQLLWSIIELPSFHWRALKNDAIRLFTGLRHVRLDSYCDPHKNGSILIENLTRIEKLTYCDDIGDDLLTTMRDKMPMDILINSLPCLREISFECTRVTPILLAQCTRIEKMRFAGSHLRNPHISCLGHIKHLILCECRFVPSTIDLSIYTTLRNLESLSIDDSRGYVEVLRFPVELTREMTRLTSLTLKRTNAFDTEALSAFTQLEKLSIEACHNTLSEHVFASLSNLTSLSIMNCREQVTDRGISILRKLTSLSIIYTKGLTLASLDGSVSTIQNIVFYADVDTPSWTNEMTKDILVSRCPCLLYVSINIPGRRMLNLNLSKMRSNRIGLLGGI